MNNRKKTLIGAVRCLVFVLITFLIILLLNEAFISTDRVATVNIHGLYQEEKDSLDVLVIGASEVYSAYSPTKAWEEYGYTSYALGAPGAYGSLYKYMLADALRTQSPKVVAFEINGFLYDDTYTGRTGALHSVLDNMNWSSVKQEAINELVSEDDRLCFYFPIIAYHDRWAYPTNPLKNDLAKLVLLQHGPTVLKGTSTVSAASSMKEGWVRGNFYFTESSCSYLMDLIEYCKEQGIEHILFFRTPHGKNAENQDILQEVWSLAKSYGCDTLDLSDSYEEMAIDLQTDFYNSEHLNVYGMEKFTSYFGGWLTSHYDLPTEHEEKLAASWDKSAKRADKLFEECKKNLEAGNKLQYSEASLYFDSEPEAEE